MGYRKSFLEIIEKNTTVYYGLSFPLLHLDWAHIKSLEFHIENYLGKHRNKLLKGIVVSLKGKCIYFHRIFP